MEKRLDATNVYMKCSYSNLIENFCFWSISPEWLAAIGTVSAVVISLGQPFWIRRGEFKNAKKALETELLYNLTQIFTGEVERPLLYGAYDYFAANFMGMVKDTKEFSKIQFIYSQFRYYDKFIQAFYITKLVDGVFATEKQLQSYNHILGLLDLDRINYDKEKLIGVSATNYIQDLRDKQINNYNQNIELISIKIKEIVKNI